MPYCKHRKQQFDFESKENDTVMPQLREIFK